MNDNVFSIFKEYLEVNGVKKTPNQYINGVKKVLQIEGTTINDLANNLPYFIYKYKYCNVGVEISKHERGDLCSYMRKFHSFLNQQIIFRVKVENNGQNELVDYRKLQLGFERSKNILNIDEFNNTDIKIIDIQQGCTLFTIGAFTIFGLHFANAVTVIKKMYSDHQNGRAFSVKEKVEVVKLAISLLDTVLSCFPSLEGNAIFEGVSFSLKMINEFITYLSNLIFEKHISEGHDFYDK